MASRIPDSRFPISHSIVRLLPRVAVAAGLTAYIFLRSRPREILAAGAGADWRPIAGRVLLGLTVARELAGSRAVLLALAAAGAACLATVLLIFSSTTATLVSGLVERLPFRPLQQAGRRVLTSVRKYVSYPAALINVLMCS